MKTASWVIINIATDQAVCETYLKKIADAINKEKYKAVPILEYLGSLSKKN